MVEYVCIRCGCRTSKGEQEDERDTCRVCDKLGDRSLVWFQRAIAEASTDAEKASLRERFALAFGRSWMLPDVHRHAKLHGAANLPTGVMQLLRERRSDA
jgi:hypothetical protein